MLQSKRVVINVSGAIFETHQATLDRYPQSLLGSDNSEGEKFFCQKSCQYYFDRDRISFESIFTFYQSSGKLYLPKHVSIDHFVRECQFFQLPEESISLLKSLEGIELLEKVKEAGKKVKYTIPTSAIEHARIFFEYPVSSKYALAYMIFQTMLITISVFGYCLATVTGSGYTLKPGNPWVIIEYITSICFLLELMSRFLLSADKRLFKDTSFLNIDILTIPPYAILAEIIPNEYKALKRFLKALQFLRIFRFLRYGKMSRRISIVYVILKDSAKDLQYFFVCFLVIVTTSGCIMYLIEKSDNGSMFVSIPESMWWSLQAYLTIGYGDVVPITVTGKFFSAFYMIIGILTLMLPVLSLMLKLVSCTSKVDLDGNSKIQEEDTD